MTTLLPLDAERVLRAWVAPDAAQERLRRDYLAHLSAQRDGTWRSCLVGHLTTSALVLDDARERTLLTLHPKVNRWLQLGGHCEPSDETLAGAAAREAREESGIAELEPLSRPPRPLRLDRHLVPCWGPGSSVAHLDVQYVFTAPPGARERISPESLDLRWWPLTTLPADADNALCALVAAAREHDAQSEISVGSVGSASPASGGAVASSSVPDANAAPSR